MAIHSNILIGKFHVERRLAGCSPWDWKELDTTERGAYVCLNITLNYIILNIMDGSEFTNTWMKCGCFGWGVEESCRKKQTMKQETRKRLKEEVE